MEIDNNFERLLDETDEEEEEEEYQPLSDDSDNFERLVDETDEEEEEEYQPLADDSDYISDSEEVKGEKRDNMEQREQDLVERADRQEVRQMFFPGGSARNTLDSDNENEVELYCDETLSSSSPCMYDCNCAKTEYAVYNIVVKEDARWNLACYHLRREIGAKCLREELWIKTANSETKRGTFFLDEKKTKMNLEASELIENAATVFNEDEYHSWERRCEECIESLREECQRCGNPAGTVNSLIALIARLEGARTELRSRLVHTGAGYNGFTWLEIETAFRRRVLTGVVINSRYIEPRRFLEDARDMVIEK
ncbi:PREDICTED: uncharacterized protein LOC105566756, partial [Vollenhovia emeryi]|uniref:uncharacterized protein LOC105566756 n=1 Tax=Vollenhovia emeryi TaxID=411798 RepID=UPI0005F450A3